LIFFKYFESNYLKVRYKRVIQLRKERRWKEEKKKRPCKPQATAGWTRIKFLKFSNLQAKLVFP